jgi:Zn-dependent peptidase ImmA (M78 family)
MSDYPVKARFDKEIKELAKQLREYFGVSDERRVDVIACAQQRSIWTVKGERGLRLDLRADDEMGADDGLTIYDQNTVIIAIKRSVRYAAYMGDGRARNTFAHEFGHAVMHDGAPKSRRTLGNDTFKFIRPFESAEHQAKEFAPAFLIHDEIAEKLGSAEEISVEFGISLESARIYFEELTDRRSRSRAAQSIQRMASEAHAVLSPAKSSGKLPFLTEPYSVCRNPTVFPIGHKFMCQTCDTVFDRFQNGDTIDDF